MNVAILVPLIIAATSAAHVPLKCTQFSSASPHAELVECTAKSDRRGYYGRCFKGQYMESVASGCDFAAGAFICERKITDRCCTVDEDEAGAKGLKVICSEKDFSSPV